jgi:uncharacterized protein YjbJ (UPF0337 family)
VRSGFFFRNEHKKETASQRSLSVQSRMLGSGGRKSRFRPALAIGEEAHPGKAGNHHDPGRGFGRAGGDDRRRGVERLYRMRVGNTARRCRPPSGVPIMSGTTDKISGIANEAIGKAKQSVGSVVGSEKLKGEGAAQEIKGDAQKAVGDAKNAVKDGANKVADAVNKNL